MLYFNTNVGATLSPVVRLGYDRRPPNRSGDMRGSWRTFSPYLLQCPRCRKPGALKNQTHRPEGGLG